MTIPVFEAMPARDVSCNSPSSLNYKYLLPLTRWSNPLECGKHRKARQQRAIHRRLKKK